MKNEEILKKAIEKAVENGLVGDIQAYEEDIKVANDFLTDYAFKLIFSHSFAKAFWGEAKTKFYELLGFEVDSWNYQNNEPNRILDWQYHLSHMVLEEEPLKYLEKFLKVT